MVDMNDLKTLAQGNSSAAGGQSPTMKVRPDDTAADVVNRLQEYFGREEKRQAVRLIFEGGEQGYLRRSDIYEFAAAEDRGIGDYDGGMIPGEDEVSLIELCCAVESCSHVLLVTRFDRSRPPMCEIHKDSTMGPCK